MHWDTRDYLIAFNMVPGVGGRRLLALKGYFGNLRRAWEASFDELIKVGGIGPKIAKTFVVNRTRISPKAEEKWCNSLGGKIITLADRDYPDYLKRLAVPPPVLYVLGKLPSEPGVAIVGTRKPSAGGIRQSQAFSRYLVRRQETIISGLARGIDYYAHKEALDSGGKTVAVLGSNFAQIYPREHKGLVGQIAQQGAVVSEFSSRCQTLPGNFPRRNRIIAAMARGVLVVQAGRKSGALVTADWALDLGLDVWAIPGEIHDPLRTGTNYLIQQGAYLVTNPADLTTGELECTQNSQIALLYQQGVNANEIAARLNLPISQVMTEIGFLQVLQG